MTPVLPLVTSCLVDHFGRDAADIGPQSTFEKLEMDSLALVELLTILHSDHGLHIPEDFSALDADASLADAAAFIEAAQPQPAAS
ncbi:acyl carrier protein [Kitasatospora sp. LaBMicrA B282]|uniref:acyl carrier protein n=1 Tax=Kitasatospora sp. LaBMicrA B282 TaxID=3420949 RepID=UPI003D0B6966